MGVISILLYLYFEAEPCANGSCKLPKKNKKSKLMKIANLCLCIVLSFNVWAQPSIINNGNDPGWSALYCNQPGAIHNGSIACIEPKCRPDEVKKNGKCMSPTSIHGTGDSPSGGAHNETKAEQPTLGMPCGVPGATNECSSNRSSISCIAPLVLQNDHCVSPASAGGTNSSSTDGSAASSDKNAGKCIVIGHRPTKNSSRAAQTITNTCNEKIGLIYCHSPSSQPGTLDTECGHNNRYFQQFTTMEPGQTQDNIYSLPVDATIHFGACFGGEGKIKQTLNGEYICR